MAAINYWTKERVVAGLKQFHADTGSAPTSRGAYTKLRGQTKNPRAYPPESRVFNSFSSLVQAWVDLGVLEATTPLPKPWGHCSRIPLEEFQAEINRAASCTDARFRLGWSSSTLSTVMRKRPDLREAWAARWVMNGHAIVRGAGPLSAKERRNIALDLALRGAVLEIEFIKYHDRPSNMHRTVLINLQVALGQEVANSEATAS